MQTKRLAMALGAACLAGCVTDDSSRGDFYRAGFVDGCRSGEERRASFSAEIFQNTGLFKTESSYRSGWRSGYQHCLNSGHDSARPSDFGEQDPL